MDRCLQEERRKIRGGIISLAKTALEYREAITYDLLTQTGHELDDVGSTLSWGAFDIFLHNVRPDSAVARQIDPEVAQWSERLKTNMILADIFDMLALINANLMAIGTHKAAKKPKPYPRPHQKKPEEEKHIGSGALPPAELRAWIERKRAEINARSSTGHDNGHTSP